MIRVPQVGDWTPSDSGPWHTMWHEDMAHVVPGFGPKHKLSMLCWCHPVSDYGVTEQAVSTISHNVAH